MRTCYPAHAQIYTSSIQVISLKNELIHVEAQLHETQTLDVEAGKLLSWHNEIQVRCTRALGFMSAVVYPPVQQAKGVVTPRNF